ncbi:MAG: hypothetical protein U1E53_13860 [Dongiaceae bacterium]
MLGLEHQMAVLAQIGGGELADLAAVVDQQQPAGRHGGRRGAVGRRRRGRRRGARRQQQDDGGARAGPAVDADQPAGAPREAVDLGQAQPGAAADLLGGEERLEGAALHLRRHALAGVGDDDLGGRRAVRHDAPRGRDAQRAAGRHRIARIAGEVEDGEVELHPVERDGRRRVVELERDGDGRPGGLADHAEDLAQAGIDVDHRALGAAGPAEGQQAARDADAALGGAADRRHQAMISRPGQPLLQQVDAAQDHHQQVVEVVGDAAGQATQPFQPAGLLERLGGAPAGPQLAHQQQQEQAGQQQADAAADGGQPDGADERRVEQVARDADMDRPAGGGRQLEGRERRHALEQAAGIDSRAAGPPRLQGSGAGRLADQPRIAAGAHHDVPGAVDDGARPVGRQLRGEHAVADPVGPDGRDQHVAHQPVAHHGDAQRHGDRRLARHDGADRCRPARHHAAEAVHVDHLARQRQLRVDQQVAFRIGEQRREPQRIRRMLAAEQPLEAGDVGRVVEERGAGQGLEGPQLAEQLGIHHRRDAPRLRQGLVLQRGPLRLQREERRRHGEDDQRHQRRDQEQSQGPGPPSTPLLHDLNASCGRPPVAGLSRAAGRRSSRGHHRGDRGGPQRAHDSGLIFALDLAHRDTHLSGSPREEGGDWQA